MTGTWQEQALCNEVDPALFMPDVYIPANTAEPIGICNRCPVKPACLDAALDEERGLPHQMRESIRGATTPRERAAIDKQRRKPAAA